MLGQTRLASGTNEVPSAEVRVDKRTDSGLGVAPHHIHAALGDFSVTPRPALEPWA